MPRINKIDSPLLIIGLGGTGFDGLMHIKRDFRERFIPATNAQGVSLEKPPRTEYVEIDTDAGTADAVKYGTSLSDGEFINISNTFSAAVVDIDKDPYVSPWWDANLRKADIDSDGAGAYRQVSRLFLFKKIGNVISSLTNKLVGLTTVPAGAADRAKRIEVKIITGLCGGTGSGTLLDVAYILRHIKRTHPALAGVDMRIEAFVIMTDVTIDHHARGSAHYHQLYSSNSYAAMKEIDFWINAEDSGYSQTVHYSQMTTVEWSGKPFDRIKLMCSINDAGVGIADAYNHNMDVISEYLLHYYAGSDEAGNESFDSVSNNEDGNAVNTDTEYAFQSAESNLSNLCSFMNHPYPVSYGYQAIGAFGNRGENEMMVKYQWQLIYEAAVNGFEKNKAIMDGQAPIDFTTSVLQTPLADKTGVLFVEFAGRHPIPRGIFSGEAPYGVDDAKGWSEPSVAIHGNIYNTFETNISNALGEEKEILKQRVWEIFIGIANEMGADITRGPLYLYDMLTKDDRCLTKQLDSYIKTVESNRNTEKSSVVNCKGDGASSNGSVNVAYKAFKDVGLVAALFNVRTNRFNDYINECKKLYAATVRKVYFEALLYALNEFKKNLAKYISVLGDVVNAVREEKKQYDSNVDIDALAQNALYNVKSMSQSLTEAFAEEASRRTFVSGMYNQIMTVTERCMDERIPASKLGELVGKAVDGLREVNFASICDLDLEAKIIRFENKTEEEIEDYAANILAPKLVSGAKTMFAASTDTNGLDDNHAALVSIVSVPANAPHVAAGIRRYCETNGINAVIKYHNLDDRIIWCNLKGGLPMHYYNQLHIYRENYNAVMARHKAFHLYMSGDIEGKGSMSDWSTLADPATVRTAVEPMENDEYATVKAAEEHGILSYEVEFRQNAKIASVVEQVLNPGAYDKLDVHAVNEKLAEIEAGAPDFDAVLALEASVRNKDEFKAAIAKLDGYIAAIDAILNDRIRSVEKPGHADDWAAAWATVLKKGDILTKQFTTGMTAHDRSALENEWKKCFERALREMIGKRPGKIDLYKANIDCIDLLNAEKNRLAGIKQKIEEHANIEEISYSTIKRYASDFISMIRSGNVKMLPAMAKGLLDGDEYTLFSHADKFPAIEDAFENFAVLPMYMRALLWYTYEGRKKNVCEGMLEAATKVANKVAEMEELNATGQSYLEATKKAKTNIETAFAQIKRAYNEDKIKKADYLNVYKPLAEEMIAELESFISIWEGFI